MVTTHTIGDAPAVTLARYAETRGKSLRTIQRWIAEDRLPEAHQDDTGRWWVPMDAEPLPARTIKAPPATDPTPATMPAAPATSPLGISGTIEEAAAALGVSPIGLRRLYADMCAQPGLPMYVGRYGPHGSLRVVVPPR